MVNLAKNPGAKANLNYHDFPMHQHLEFTSPLGQLLPVYHDFLDPGDKVRCSSYMKTRTQPLASAAMTKITEHLEWFFVPIHQIYKPFTGLLYGVQDFDSSLFSKDNSELRMANRFPYINIKKLMQGIKDNENVIYGLKTLKDENLYNEGIRLMEHLGIPAETLLDYFGPFTIPGRDNVFSFTPLFACAYQKIWMDHYRNSDRVANDPACYSLDQFFTNSDIIDYWNGIASGVEEMGAVQFFQRFFQMRYRPVAKDFYTNNYPSPVFGNQSVSAQDYGVSVDAYSTLNKVNQWLTGVRRTYGIDKDGNDEGRDVTTVALDYTVDGHTRDLVSHELNPANIRTLFAAEKLLELTRRAGKHYDRQTLAHFGVKVPETIEGQSFRLGSHSQDIVIGDVVATADTPASGDYKGTPLGEIGGKGYSAAGSPVVDFTAPCHGVLMCLYSSEPLIDYIQQGADKLNCLIEKSDFYLPEYDNLGMQPLFNYQLRLENGSDQDEGTDNTAIMGWQYRYMEFKQKHNRVIGALKWTQRHWTVARDSRDAAGSDVYSYYHDPDALNSIMEYSYLKGYVKANEAIRRAQTASELYEQDPLIHEVQFDVKKASKKSPYGLMDL